MNTNSPLLVSIVIPAYNLARYLGETIESILSQDYPNIEVIVLDDGSTDDTRRVLEKYAGRIYAESQPNMGQVNTMNKGWLMSKGDILGFISADDTLLPGAVGKAVARLAANPDAVLTYCDFNLIDANSRIIRRVTTPELSFADMLTKVVCPPGPGAFFRRSGYEATGLWDNSLKIMLDYDYWLRLGLKGPFLRIPEVLAQYRVHETSQTFAGVDEARAYEPVAIVARFFENRGLPESLRPLKKQALSNAHLICAQLNYRAGRYRLGNLNARKAFTLYPRNFLTVGFVRLLLNVMLNRVGHRALWKMRGLFQGGHD